MRGYVGTIHPTHRSSLCNIGADCSCIRKLEVDGLPGMAFLPPTSDFPPDPEPLIHHSSPGIKPKETTRMGEIADTLRFTMRQHTQADARLHRGLAEELGDGATAAEETRALIQPEAGAAATEAQLLAMKNAALQELCAQRGIKAPKRPGKDVMVGMVRADPNAHRRGHCCQGSGAAVGAAIGGLALQDPPDHLDHLIAIIGFGAVPA
jgi:hypothetical protein